MRRWLAPALLFLLAVSTAHAHRLDEYLQATLLRVRPGAVEGTTRLVPGVAVAGAVLAGIDADGDGTLSAAEQQAYAQVVMRDLMLEEDGHALTPRLLSHHYPTPAEMHAGTGTIELVWTAPLLPGGGAHTLGFEDRHRPVVSVFLVNALEPQDDIRILAQDRSSDQARFTLSFSGGTATPAGFSWSGFRAALHLGARHIAEGTDHLLFLLTLLLPAPLLALAGRWQGRAALRVCLVHILGIVTAFTLGHSATLLLATAGVVRLPERPVEVLIALSILVSAVHALRPLFPGREALVAAGFGLVHGLAFASAIAELGFAGQYRLVTVLGFNLGIEAMQLAVVAAVLPSLLLLSRTPWYGWLRVPGAAIAAGMAAVWVVARATPWLHAAGTRIEGFATHGPSLAAGLLVLAVAAWVADRLRLASTRLPRPV